MFQEIILSQSESTVSPNKSKPMLYAKYMFSKKIENNYFGKKFQFIIFTHKILKPSRFTTIFSVLVEIV